MAHALFVAMIVFEEGGGLNGQNFANWDTVFLPNIEIVGMQGDLYDGMDTFLSRRVGCIWLYSSRVSWRFQNLRNFFRHLSGL